MPVRGSARARGAEGGRNGGRGGTGQRKNGKGRRGVRRTPSTTASETGSSSPSPGNQPTTEQPARRVQGYETMNPDQLLLYTPAMRWTSRYDLGGTLLPGPWPQGADGEAFLPPGEVRRLRVYDVDGRLSLTGPWAHTAADGGAFLPRGDVHRLRETYLDEMHEWLVVKRCVFGPPVQSPFEKERDVARLALKEAFYQKSVKRAARNPFKRAPTLANIHRGCVDESGQASLVEQFCQDMEVMDLSTLHRKIYHRPLDVPEVQARLLPGTTVSGDLGAAIKFFDAVLKDHAAWVQAVGPHAIILGLKVIHGILSRIPFHSETEQHRALLQSLREAPVPPPDCHLRPHMISPSLLMASLRYRGASESGTEPDPKRACPGTVAYPAGGVVLPLVAVLNDVAETLAQHEQEAYPVAQHKFGARLVSATVAQCEQGTAAGLVWLRGLQRRPTVGTLRDLLRATAALEDIARQEPSPETARAVIAAVMTVAAGLMAVRLPAGGAEALKRHTKDKLQAGLNECCRAIGQLTALLCSGAGKFTFPANKGPGAKVY
jgi:hypothetical protein